MTAAISLPQIRRVSRRDLAQNRIVWFATAAMFAMFAAVTAVMAFSATDQDQTRLLAYLAYNVTCALAILWQGPPQLDSIRNHVLLLSVYVSAAFGLWAMQPDPTAAFGVAIFIGPLAAIRLPTRRAIFGHHIAATVLLAALGVVGLATGEISDATVLGLLVIVPSMWALGSSTMIVFEAAESQGDELERLVRRDPLTGVGNRRMLMEHLEDELGRHRLLQRKLSVIALDLDGFKTLNDTIGHAAGDELLRIVAEALTASVGDRDVVVRQGGDEFCVILPETSASHAVRSANAIRASLAAIDFEGQGISSGTGIATFPDDAEGIDALLHVADHRLGENKRGPAA